MFLVIEVSRAITKPRAQPALGVVNAPEFDLIVEGPRVPEFIDLQEQAHEVEMGLIASLRMTANDHLRHHQLRSATYLLDGDAPPEYRLWFEAGAVDARVSLNLARRSARKMGADVRRVLRQPGTSRSLGLVGRVSTANEDATVEFLVSFTALEQYVKGQIASGELVARFKDLAAHRYPAAQAVSDFAEFRALYRVRNKLAHEGERVDDRSLARRVRTLLIRYLTPPS